MNLTKMSYFPLRSEMNKEIARRAEEGICLHCADKINKKEGRIGYCSYMCGISLGPILNWRYENTPE